MDHSIYYEHKEDHPLVSIDSSIVPELPSGWLFMAYSNRRDYAIYGIWTDYRDAKYFMDTKPSYFGDWTKANTFERIIMFDPEHPILYWGYGEQEPTYLVVWEFCSVKGTTTELLPNYDWSQYTQFDDSSNCIYDYCTDGTEEWFVDGVDEDTYSHHVLIGKNEEDAIERAKGWLFRSDVSLEEVELTKYDKYVGTDRRFRNMYEVPYAW